MKKFEVTWFGDDDDIKFFRTKGSRICLIEFHKNDIEKARDLFKDVKFDSGVYIIEADIDGETGLYVGESDNVWDRVSNHINGKTNLNKNKLLKGYKNISRALVILSSDAFDEFTKSEIHYFENKLINELKFLRNQLTRLNLNDGFSKNINVSSKKLLDQELSNIKKALYFVGKDYFKSTFNEVEQSLEQFDGLSLDKSEWITITPIKNTKRNIKVKGQFEFNQMMKVIKIYEGTVFSGVASGSATNINTLIRYLEKGIQKNELSGEVDIDSNSYSIKVTKTHLLKPSSAGIFIRGGVNNGWTFWKDEKGNKIEKYR